jgi:hypothetical protein
MRILPVHHDDHLKRARGGSDKSVYRSEQGVGGIGEDKEGSEPLVEKGGDLVIRAPSSRYPGTETKARRSFSKAFAITS